MRGSLRTVAKYGALVIGGGVGAFGGVEAYTVGPDYAHHYVTGETPAEHTIEGAIKRAYGKHIMVHCVNRPGEGGDVPMSTLGNHTYGYNIMRINPTICASLLRFSVNPHSSEVPGDGLEAVGHELSHTYGVRDESIAECEGVQRVDALAQAFGATPKEATQIAANEAALYEAPNETYEPPADCVDNGPFDLDPHHPGSFPGKPYYDMSPLFAGPGQPQGTVA